MVDIVWRNLSIVHIIKTIAIPIRSVSKLHAILQREQGASVASVCVIDIFLRFPGYVFMNIKQVSYDRICFTYALSNYQLRNCPGD